MSVSVPETIRLRRLRRPAPVLGQSGRERNRNLRGARQEAELAEILILSTPEMRMDTWLRASCLMYRRPVRPPHVETGATLLLSILELRSK